MVKIVDFKRFVVCSVVFGVLLCIGILVIINNTFSHTETKYKTIYAEEGDTLWNIASVEQANNEYFRNKDVRYIVSSIKKANNLDASSLRIGQKLVIPIN